MSENSHFYREVCESEGVTITLDNSFLKNVSNGAQTYDILKGKLYEIETYFIRTMWIAPSALLSSSTNYLVQKSTIN